jgi:translocation and assembly module TamB
MHPGARALRFVVVALRVLSLVSTATMLLALVSLELPPVRRFIVRQVNDALRTSFAGRITIEKVDHIGLTAIRGARVRVDDPEGTRVLLVDGADVRISAISTLRSVLSKEGDRVIDLAEVRLAYVDADLDVDGAGGLRLAKAFQPRDEKPSPGRKTAIRLGRVAMDHAWLHGRPPGAPLVDADVDRLAASAFVGSTQKVDLTGARITTRAMPQHADVHVDVTASFAGPSPSGEDRAARADARGDIGGIPMSAHISIDGKAIDAVFDVPKATPEMIDAVAPSLHATRDLSLHAEARGRLPQIVATARATAGSGVVELRVDAATGTESTVHATLAAEGFDAHALSASAPSTDLGASAELDARVHANGAIEGNLSLAADLSGTHAPTSLLGSAELHARGAINPGATLDIDADLTASKLTRGDLHAERGWLRAHVRGPSDDPRIDAIFQGSEIAVAGLRVATVAVTTHGSLRRSDVAFGIDAQDAIRIDGRASIETGAATTVRNASVTLSRDEERAVIDVRSLRVAGPDIRLDGLTIEGLGDPVHAEARKIGDELVVKASSNEIDLARVAKLLRLTEIRDGHLAFDVDLGVRRSVARGHVRAALVNGEFARARNASGELEASFDGKAIDARVHANVGDIGRIDVDRCHLEIDGPLGASSLKSASGAVSFDSEVDLARIRRLLPRGSVPLTDLSGKLRLVGQASRAKGGDAIPDVQVTAETHGLSLSGRGKQEQVDGARVLGYRPWSLEGVDVKLAANVARATGATEVAASVSDRRGLVASVDVRAPEVPYREWIHGKPFSAERLGALPVAAHLAVPRRELKTLPAILKTQQFAGDISLDLAVDGTLSDPDARFSLEAFKLASSVGARVAPLDAKVTARYARGEGTVDVDVSSAERRLLAGELKVSARLDDLLGRGTTTQPAWRASTHVRLSEFPLETTRYFGDVRLKGFASGDVAVENWHEDARAKIDLAFRDLALGRAKFPRGTASAAIEGNEMRAAVRLDQTDGFLETDAKIGMTWGRDSTPKPTTSVPAFAILKAKGLRASALLPFVSDAVSELDGRIDADARIDLPQGGGPPNMKGTLTLRDGTVQLARLGEPLHGVNMNIVVTPDGLVRLDDLTAHGSSGTLAAKAIARLDGLDFVGARANLRIPRRDPLPVDLDGQDMGDVDGEMSLSVDRSADRRITKIAVDVPVLHADLPLSSSHKTQELGEAKGVRIGYFRRPRQFILLPMDASDLGEHKTNESDTAPSRTDVAIHLGNDVEIKRGTTLKVQLEGDPKIEVAEQARMSGQIRLTRGTLEVQGKRFEIERGTVTFVGDEPGNPQILVTAGWTAPDGTRVYADFVGPLKTGKVKLRSEPARSQDEILALIVFGTAEGSSSTPYAQEQPSGTTRAGTTAGGFATEGLSKGLDDLTGLDVSTKIDTTNSANPKPEIEVRIARDISLELGYVIGTPPPGTNPDKTLVTLDWRFRRNWSMEATFGDQGSSIMDFVWQYRY